MVLLQFCRQENWDSMKARSLKSNLRGVTEVGVLPESVGANPRTEQPHAPRVFHDGSKEPGSPLGLTFKL